MKEAELRFDTHVELIGVTSGVERRGLAGRYRRATFRITSGGAPPIEWSVDLHPAWPDGDVERVARAFLAGRLREAAAVVAEGAIDLEALEALWRRVKPADETIPA